MSGASFLYMWLGRRPPERGQCEGRKNLKQRRSLGWGLKKRSGGKLEGKCGVRGWVSRRG